MMPLVLANVGEPQIVKRIGGNPETKRHLEDLGFTVGGEVYTAVTGMTTYADGSESPTFLINTPDYTLTFHAAQS